jgi:hypothetical protein
MTNVHLDWRRGGYFFDVGILKACPKEWQHWAHIFDRAKHGDFSDTPSLLDIFFNTENYLLRTACRHLLGDAGSTDAINKAAMLVRKRFADLEPIGGDEALDLASALAFHGQLVFVRDILLIFEWNLSASDSRIFTLLLSQMLEPKWGPLTQQPRREEEFVKYRDRVTNRAQELALNLGSEQAYVFMGQELHVPDIARLLLKNLGNSHFEEASHWLFRHRFEASTGINCTTFFKEDKFQPLTAAAALEEFLSSSEVKRFVPGHKYFFGWQVP